MAFLLLAHQSLSLNNQSAMLKTNTSSSPSLPSINYADLLHLLLSSIPEYRAAMDINEYGLLVVTVIGCLANLLALVVMLNLCHIPTYNYMAALAIADTSVLIGPCFIRWLLTQGVDIRAHHTALCRVLYFQTHWSFAMSAWILVAMTMDRFVAISFPLRSRLLSTPKRARVVILILAVVLTLINCHFFFIMEVKESSGENVCIGFERYDHFLQSIWPWLDATIYSFAPFFFLFVFNILILKNHRDYLRINVILTGRGSVQQQGYTAPPNLNRRLTIILFTVTFSFIALTAPRALLTIIRYDVFDFKPQPNVVDFQVLAEYTLTSSVVNLLMFVNHSINFFLYCLTGKKFRQKLTQTFRNTCTKWKKPTNKSRVAPSELSTTWRSYFKKNNSVLVVENLDNVQENEV